MTNIHIQGTKNISVTEYAHLMAAAEWGIAADQSDD